ncbi:MAG: aminoacyl-tRNA hydrolase [Methylacidiphilales bacterium]|nr:aminoacyl-tRNA hydrolase [Candidatus Methylacidiphilales bacterium]
MPEYSNYPCKLLVGIGNKPLKYALTRHNVGFWFVDQMTNLHSITLQSDSYQKEIEFTKLNDFWISKPSEWINLSGVGVAYLKKKFLVQNNEIVVVHDEVDLPVGRVRVKFGGGHAGHNGIRNMIDMLGGADFWRIRVGIGRPQVGKETDSHVLSKPIDEERQIIDTRLSLLSNEINNFMSGNFHKMIQSIHTQT